MLIRTSTQEDTLFVALIRFSSWNDCSMTAQAMMVHQAVLQLRVHPKTLMQLARLILPLVWQGAWLTSEPRFSKVISVSHCGCSMIQQDLVFSVTTCFMQYQSLSQHWHMITGSITIICGSKNWVSPGCWLESGHKFADIDVTSCGS